MSDYYNNISELDKSSPVFPSFFSSSASRHKNDNMRAHENENANTHNYILPPQLTYNTNNNHKHTHIHNDINCNNMPSPFRTNNNNYNNNMFNHAERDFMRGRGVDTLVQSPWKPSERTQYVMNTKGREKEKNNILEEEEIHDYVTTRRRKICTEDDDKRYIQGKEEKNIQEKENEEEENKRIEKQYKVKARKIKGSVSQILHTKNTRPRPSLLYRFSTFFGYGGDGGGGEILKEKEDIYRGGGGEGEGGGGGGITEFFASWKKWIAGDSKQVVATRMDPVEKRALHLLRHMGSLEEWLLFFRYIRSLKKKQIICIFFVFFVCLFLLFIFAYVLFHFITSFSFDHKPRGPSVAHLNHRVAALKNEFVDSLRRVDERQNEQQKILDEFKSIFYSIGNDPQDFLRLPEEAEETRKEISKIRKENDMLKKTIYNLSEKLEQKMMEFNTFIKKDKNNAPPETDKKYNKNKNKNNSNNNVYKVDENIHFVKLKEQVESIIRYINTKENDKNSLAIYSNNNYNYNKEEEKEKEKEKEKEEEEEEMNKKNNKYFYNKHNNNNYNEKEEEKNRMQYNKEEEKIHIEKIVEHYINNMHEEYKEELKNVNEKMTESLELMQTYIIDKLIEENSKINNNNNNSSNNNNNNNKYKNKIDEKNKLGDIILSMQKSIQMNIQQQMRELCKNNNNSNNNNSINKEIINIPNVNYQRKKTYKEEEEEEEEKIGREEEGGENEKNNQFDEFHTYKQKQMQILKVVDDLYNEVVYDGSRQIDWALLSLGATIDTKNTAPSLRGRDGLEVTLNLAQFFCNWHGVAKPLGKDPAVVLTPQVIPGQCFAFDGHTGNVTILLPATIRIKSVSLDHVMAELNNNIPSAPKTFSVFADIDSDFLHTLGNNKNVLCTHSDKQCENGRTQERPNSFALSGSGDQSQIYLGTFTHIYPSKTRSHTYNIATPVPSKRITFAFTSNYGASYTCIYRLRVHGEKLRQQH